MKEPTTETHPLDEDRDPASAAFVRGLAAEVAAQYGGDLNRMRRARGYLNATWVGDGVAVRITHTPVDMAAEVALARALPNEVGHPRILGVGTIEGHDWIVTEEVRGQNLHEAWPTMTPAERRRAIRQLWERVQVVHNATRRSDGSWDLTPASFRPHLMRRRPPLLAPVRRSSCPTSNGRGSPRSTRATTGPRHSSSTSSTTATSR